MTLHVVDEGDAHRLYDSTGTRLSAMSWQSQPTGRDLTDALDDHYDGASVLANETARRQFFDACNGDVVYHGSDDGLP